MNLLKHRRKLKKGLTNLLEEHRKTRQQLGGLSHTVGYFLENEAYKYLSKLLKADFGITVEGSLIREYTEVSPNKYEEINIIGKGRRDGKEIWFNFLQRVYLQRDYLTYQRDLLP